MFNAYKHTDARSVCIICDERVGTIQTIDGMVCSYCMPKELLPQAVSLRKHRIMIYCKTNPGWESCAGMSQHQEEAEIEDRSAAITHSTPTILADELNAQIGTAESIDIVVSFIKQSGLSLLLGRLADFSRRGKLRVITTAYMGATEYEALNELFRLPNTEVRMELNAESTRLHAKSFIFNRPDGDSTVFVGSANISRTALTDGEEWVVKLLEKDVPEVVRELRMSYGTLWNSENVKSVSQRNRAEIESALKVGKEGLVKGLKT